MRAASAIVFSILTIGHASAQAYNLNDLSPQELNLIDRGLFFVGGWQLHDKIQAQIEAQNKAAQVAFEQQRKAYESSLREQIKKELETPQ